MSHGYHETEIKIEMHGFDPFEGEKAMKYIKFDDTEVILTRIEFKPPFFFYLNRVILEELLSETRNGIEFNVLNIFFGLDTTNQFVLLITRANGKRHTGGYEEYEPVHQYYIKDTVGISLCEKIEYAIKIDKDTLAIKEDNIIDVNGSEYSDLINRYKQAFHPFHPEAFLKISAKEVAGQLKIPANSHILIPENTFAIGYRIGKQALRNIWQQDGKWEGVKIFLGYGSSFNQFPSANNVHLIAIGTENPDLVIDNTFNGHIWATVIGSKMRTIDGSSTCVVKIDGLGGA